MRCTSLEQALQEWKWEFWTRAGPASWICANITGISTDTTAFSEGA